MRWSHSKRKQARVDSGPVEDCGEPLSSSSLGLREGGSDPVAKPVTLDVHQVWPQLNAVLLPPHEETQGVKGDFKLGAHTDQCARHGLEDPVPFELDGKQLRLLIRLQQYLV